METLVEKLRAAGCVFAEDEARLLSAAARTPAELAAMAERRAAGEPLEHVVGWVDFCGLRIAVEPRVFVPRRRTEFLVRQAAARTRPGAVVVDLCCGSGAVGAALGAVELHAVDIDPAAVRCARRNLAPAGTGLAGGEASDPREVPAGTGTLRRVYEGDLYDPLPATLRGRVAVLVANVPYVPSGQVELLPREARQYEAPAALDGGTDGLDVLRRVAAAAPLWLAPGGHLLVEASNRQAPTAAEILAHAGLAPQVITSAELDTAVIAAQSPAAR